MNIALIYPKSLPGIPYGLLFIGAVLEQNNFNVAIFDNDSNDHHFIKSIINFKPDIIGYSLNTMQISRAIEINLILKQHLPNAIYVAGGVHTTALPYDTIKLLDLDYAILHEGEYTMLELCQYLKKGKDPHNIKGIAYIKDDKLIRTEFRPFIKDLDSLPYPARHLINFKNYILPPGSIRGQWIKRSTYYLSSRGCPFNCSFCASPMLWKRRVRVHSIDRIINEIKFLIKEYNIEAIQFLDDILGINTTRVIQLCDRIKQEKLNLKFSCQLRVDTINEKMLKALKSAGFVQIEFGIESGSNKILKIFNKETNKDKIREAVKLVKKFNMRTMGSFIIGNPYETEEDLRETEKLAEELDLDFADFFILTPFPGTGIYEMAIKNKWIKNFNYKTWDITTPVMEINFSRHYIEKKRAFLENKFAKKKYQYYIKHPYTLFSIFVIFITHPLSILYGLKKFLKTFSINDFTINFLRHWRYSVINSEGNKKNH